MYREILLKKEELLVLRNALDKYIYSEEEKNDEQTARHIWRMVEEHIAEIENENHVTYELMTSPVKHGRYVPHYDKLIDESACEAEADAWRKAREVMTDGFTFEFVACIRQQCGHWEVFQHPIGTAYTPDEALDNLVRESRKRRCTKCICNWNH